VKDDAGRDLVPLNFFTKQEPSLPKWLPNGGGEATTQEGEKSMLSGPARGGGVCRGGDWNMKGWVPFCIGKSRGNIYGLQARTRDGRLPEGEKADGSGGAFFFFRPVGKNNRRAKVVIAIGHQIGCQSRRRQGERAWSPGPSNHRSIIPDLIVETNLCRL